MHSKSRGFTLVELAIVMIIIGLLIGGILKGQALVESARINRTVSQVKAYQAAHSAFYDSYRAIPGDIPRANTRLPNCTSDNFCVSGNGDLRIGGDRPFVMQDVSGATENTQFWKHLVITDLIGEIKAGANPAAPEWGVTYPEAPLEGGFQVIFSSQFAAGQLDWRGHWLRLQRNADGDSNEIPGEYAVTPHQARIIDSKMDDGFPGSGEVQSYDTGSGPIAGCEGPLPYDETFIQKNCNLIFRLHL